MRKWLNHTDYMLGYQVHISSAPWSKILSKLFLAKVQRMSKIQINLWSKCAAIVLRLEEFGCSGLLSADPEPNRNSELLVLQDLTEQEAFVTYLK